jgi:hypothetical protein
MGRNAYFWGNGSFWKGGFIRPVFGLRYGRPGRLAKRDAFPIVPYRCSL